MREFVLRASKTVTSPGYINLNDIPGAGRLDVVCRCVTNALFVSNSMRRDTVIHAVLEGPSSPPRTISFDGNRLRSLAPDERNAASHVRIALERGSGLRLNESVESEPGVTISKRSFESLVKEKGKTTQLVYLHPEGADIREFGFKEDVCFVLGDYIGLPRKSERLLERCGAQKVSVGRMMYFASQVITVCHVELDRRLAA